MRWIGVRVQEANRQRLDAGGFQSLKLSASLLGVEWLEDRPVGGDALFDFGHFRKQGLGLLDGQLEQLRPVLIANPQYFAVAASRHKSGLGPLPCEQRVGAPRRSQPQGTGRNRLIEPQSQKQTD